jgi:hypothetical protein
MVRGSIPRERENQTISEEMEPQKARGSTPSRSENQTISEEMEPQKARGSRPSWKQKSNHFGRSGASKGQELNIVPVPKANTL